MSIKIEFLTDSGRAPKKLEETVRRVLKSVPREHLRGLDRIRIVDSINDPRLRVGQSSQLPGLYHPKQGSQAAWLEVALSTLLPQQKPFYKRFLPRLSFKANLAAVVFSLIGQHHYMTMRHSVKKNQLEMTVRAYTEKQLKVWSENEHGFRTRLFKPLQPTLERWARALRKRAKEKNPTTQVSGRRK